MVGWSSIARPAAQFAKYRAILQTPVLKNAVQLQMREMSSGHHHMIIQPTKFQWNKFKSYLHFYTMLGVLPITALVLYCNIFIGPAQLQEIPADYEPKYWEYHKHPISRFIARYMFTNPQQEYEKYLHFLYEEDEKAQIRLLEERIRAKMSERNDYKAYYYRPITAKYQRLSKETADELVELRGDV